MTPTELPCPICRRPLALAEMEPGVQTCPCPRRRRFEAAVFRPPELPVAAPRPAADGAGEAPSENLCAHHAGNAAVASCERCGVFICDLCRIEVEDRTLCPACFERLSAAGELRAVKTRFRDYGSLALVCALSGLIVSCLGVFLGPAAIYYAARSLRQKREMGEKEGRATAWIAGGLGALSTLAGALLWVAMIWGLTLD